MAGGGPGFCKRIIVYCLGILFIKLNSKPVQQAFQFWMGMDHF